MQFEDMAYAVSDAEQTLSLADRFAEKMARMLMGRLRKIGSMYVLRSLKQELRDFNMTTGEWK